MATRVPSHQGSVLALQDHRAPWVLQGVMVSMASMVRMALQGPVDLLGYRDHQVHLVY